MIFVNTFFNGEVKKNMKTGDIIRNEILFHGYSTMKEFVRKIGIHYSTLLSYTNNTCNNHNAEILYIVAQGLGVTMEYLLTGREINEEKLKNKKSCQKMLEKFDTLPGEIQNRLIDLIYSTSEILKKYKELDKWLVR